MMGKGAIILVVGFSLVFGIIGVRVNGLSKRAIDNMAYYHNVTNAHEIASAGANAAMSMVYQNPNLRGDVTSQSFSSGNFASGSFSARMDSLSTTRLRLRTVASYKGFYDTVEVYFSPFKENSFSMYAWMSNFEGNVFWITGDTVWGRVHSNGALHIDGKPVFMEKVTTAKNIDPKPGSGNSKAVYKKGYETGVAAINYPTDLSQIINASTSGGRKYTSNIYVTLSPGSAANNDGKVYVRTSSYTGTIIDSISLNDVSFNGALYSTGTVSVKGTLDGRLTIAAGSNVVVADDILYAQNPLTNSTADDMLGLVSDNDVIIADNAANNSNCEVHAAVFSRTGSFTAENYNSRPVAGTLKLIGSIVQNNRGPVAQYSGSSINHGFSKRYYFDTRYADPSVRPPFFPGFYTQTMTLTNWWENVRVPTF